MYMFSHPSFPVTTPDTGFRLKQPPELARPLTDAEIQGIHNAINAALQSEQDSAGILQGVRRIRKGKLHNPGVHDGLQRKRRALREAGIYHCVITEEELRKEPMAGIRKALSKGARVRLELYQRHALLEPLHQRSMTVAELRIHAQQLGFDPMAVEKLALGNRTLSEARRISPVGRTLRPPDVALRIQARTASTASVLMLTE